MNYKHLFSLFALPLCVILLITLAIGVTAASDMDTKNFTFKDDFTSVQSEVTYEGNGSGKASVSGAVFSLEATGVDATSGCNATPAKPATTTVTLVPENAVAITYSYTGSISVTASVTDNKDGTYTVIVGAGEAFQFSVNAKNATKASGTLTIESIAETASKKPADRAIFSVDSTPYDYLDDAIEAAKTSTSKLIVVERDGAAYHSSYESKDDNDGVYDKTFTIPSGVTLLVPFNGNNNYYIDAVAYAGEVMETPTAFRTLILPEDTQLIIDGSMNVAGKFAYTNSGGQSGSPSGYLGFVEMESDSNITVNGKLYAYGYITGDGTVTVNSGGSVYEILQMPEFRGGSQSTSMKNKVFPLSQFYVQNIEVPMTIYQGATEETFASVYVYGGGLVNKYFPTGITLFGSGGMFELGAKNQYAKKWYDPSTDRLHIEINGDVTMNSIKLVMDASVLGSKSIDSKDYVLPINGAFEIRLKSGSSLSIPSNQDVLLQPGAKIIIEQNATCTVNSKLYIYDAAQWGPYCIWGHAGAGDANGWDTPSIPVAYSPTRTKVRLHVFPRGLFKDADNKDISITEDPAIYEGIFGKNSGDQINAEDLATYLTMIPDATIQVDGTLSGNIYTTANGANIFSTGTGTFTQSATEDANVYQFIMATDDSFVVGGTQYINALSNPAKLVNDNMEEGTTDNDFTETAAKGAGTYKYNADHGRWDKVVNEKSHTVTETIIREASCIPGEKKVACSCGYSQTAEIPASGEHSYNPVVTDPTCGEEGYTTYTCSVCNDTYTGDPVAALGHSYESEVTEPTCTVAGFTKHTCTVCGDTYNDTETQPTGIHTDADGKEGAGFLLCDGCNAPVARLASLEASADAATELRMKFYIHPSLTTAEDGSKLDMKALVQFAGVKATEETVSLSNMETDKSGRYVFVCNVNSGEMRRNMTVSFTDANGNSVIIIDGQTSADAVRRSVADYAELVLANGSEKQKNVIKALLTYGGYAQIYFNVDADNPVYNLLGETPNLDAVTIPTLESLDTKFGDIQFTQAEVFLQSAIKMQYTYTAVTPDDDSFLLTYAYKNQPYTKAITPTSNTVNKNTVYYLVVEEIPAAYFGHKYAIDITAGENTGTIAMSVYDYLYLLLNPKNPEKPAPSLEMVNLAKAMYLYGEAANAFFFPVESAP